MFYDHAHGGNDNVGNGQVHGDKFPVRQRLSDLNEFMEKVLCMKLKTTKTNRNVYRYYFADVRSPYEHLKELEVTINDDVVWTTDCSVKSSESSVEVVEEREETPSPQQDQPIVETQDLVQELPLCIDNYTQTEPEQSDDPRTTQRIRKYVSETENSLVRLLFQYFPWLRLNVDEVLQFRTPILRFQFLSLIYQTLSQLYAPLRKIAQEAGFPFDDWDRCISIAEREFCCDESEDTTVQDTLNSEILKLRMIHFVIKLKHCLGHWIRDPDFKLTREFQQLATSDDATSMLESFEKYFLSPNAISFTIITYLGSQQQLCHKSSLLPISENSISAEALKLKKLEVGKNVYECIKKIPFVPGEIKHQLNTEYFEAAFSYVMDSAVTKHMNWEKLSVFEILSDQLCTILKAVHETAFFNT